LPPIVAVAEGSSRARIRDKALALGFDAVGFTSASLSGQARERLTAFLAAGRHGDMGWLAEKQDRRSDPKTLWPDARSIIVLGLNYAPAEDPLQILKARAQGAISVYARNRDYHDVVKKRLKTLARWLVETQDCMVKVFVDTAPVMEKPLAQAGGIGWQGKHTNLVSRTFGSWLFLGEIYTTLDLDADPAEEDHCGACRRCLDVCPTAAFPAPYQLDARRCISYLTIEHKGPIPRALRAMMGNRIYGCDDCLAVCPWNKFAKAATVPTLLPRSDLAAPSLAAFATLDDAAFRKMFSGSPIKRIGRDRFVRNVLIAIGNSGRDTLSGAAVACLDDHAALVRGAAVWAASRLLAYAAFSTLATRCLPQEHDAEVRGEWSAALQTMRN